MVPCSLSHWSTISSSTIHCQNNCSIFKDSMFPEEFPEQCTWGSLSAKAQERDGACPLRCLLQRKHLKVFSCSIYLPHVDTSFAKQKLHWSIGGTISLGEVCQNTNGKNLQVFRHFARERSQEENSEKRQSASQSITILSCEIGQSEPSTEQSKLQHGWTGDR